MPRPGDGGALDPAATEPLVYGILNDNLILLPEAVALAVRGDLRAICFMQTYGEARRLSTGLLLVPGVYGEYEVVESSRRDSDPVRFLHRLPFRRPEITRSLPVQQPAMG